MTNCPDLPGETWLPIPDWPDYEVSSYGRVVSYKRKRPRILKPNRERYPQVHLSHFGEHWTVRVHQLVALAFLGSCPDGCEVCHCDGDPTNNHISNLRYDSHVQNMRDARYAGTFGKLTDEEVFSIRRLCAQDQPDETVASRYDISPGTVASIRLGHLHSTLRGPITKRPLGRAVLSDKDVRHIRATYALGGITMQALADQYNVDISTISRTINGELHKDISEQEAA